jgi:hypothetical protein
MVATSLLATGDIELASDGVDDAGARARWPRVSAMDAPTGSAYEVALNHVRRVARPPAVGTARPAPRTSSAAGRADSLGISRSTVPTTLRDAHNRLGYLLDPAP